MVHHSCCFHCLSTPYYFTYLRVCARQRPSGVAWDAVPLRVRGLNKAAGNPPLFLDQGQRLPMSRPGGRPRLGLVLHKAASSRERGV